MPILNYTTNIAAAKTVAQLQQKIAQHGASGTHIAYGPQGHPLALTFEIWLNDQLVQFRLPSQREGVLAAMKADKKIPRSQCTDEQALRVAWRIVKDWTEAQLAMIDAGLATLPQVMLPYAVTNTGQTVYERIEAEGPGLLQLEAPA